MASLAKELRAVAFATVAVGTVSCLLVTDFADYRPGGATASSATVSSSSTAGGSMNGCGAGGTSGAQGGCGALGTSENCGYCGHDCLNGSCADGTCTPGQVGTLAGYGLVADDTHLFFTNEPGDTVFRIGKTAQDLVSPEIVLSDATSVATLMVHGQHFYAAAGASIVRVTKDGQSAESLVSLSPPRNRVLAMVVDGDHLYYTSSYAPGLRRIPLRGGGELPVADAPPALGLVIDSDAIYFTVPGDDGVANGAIMRFAKSSLGQSTTAQAVATNVEAPRHLVLVENDLYVTSNSQVLRVPKTGVEPPTTIADFQTRVSALSTDGCELYVAAGANDPMGVVAVMSLDGAEVHELHAGIFVYQAGIVGDRAAVFHGGGSGIYRIVR